MGSSIVKCLRIGVILKERGVIGGFVKLTTKFIYKWAKRKIPLIGGLIRLKRQYRSIARLTKNLKNS